MNLSLYISQLLYRYACVVVPDFGSFLTEVKSARLQPGSSTFYPPYKYLSFNMLIKKHDGLLANHVARQLNISYEEALEQITIEVALWKQILSDKGTLILKDIGELRTNPEGNWVFSAYNTNNYLVEAFGLSPVVSPIIKRNIQESSAKETISVVKFATEVVQPIQTEEIRKPKIYRLLRYAGIAASVSAMILVADQWYKGQVKEQTMIVERSVQEKVQQQIQQATFTIEVPVDPITMIVKEEKLFYHIVAGAYREEANAKKEYESLSKEGYKAKQLPKNKHGLYPVVYGSYPSYEQAQQAAQEIRKINPEAWLLFQEL